MMKRLLLLGLLLVAASSVLGAELVGVWKSNIPVTLERMTADPQAKSRIKAALEDLGEIELRFTNNLLIATRNGVTSTAVYRVKDRQGNCYGLSVEGETEGVSIYLTYCLEGDLMYLSVDNFREYYSRQ